MKQIVICCNDYPEEVMPVGTTDEQAEKRCKELQVLKEAVYKGYSMVPLLYFHWHEVSVYEC